MGGPSTSCRRCSRAWLRIGAPVFRAVLQGPVPTFMVDLSSARRPRPGCDTHVGTARGQLFSDPWSSCAIPKRFGDGRAPLAPRPSLVSSSFVRRSWPPGMRVRVAIGETGSPYRVRAPKVDGTDAVTWADRILSEMCRRTGPGLSRAALDHWTSSGPTTLNQALKGTRAVGVDIGHSISGLYWLTFLLRQNPMLSCWVSRTLLTRTRCPGRGNRFWVFSSVLADRPEWWSELEYQADLGTPGRNTRGWSATFWKRESSQNGETVGLPFRETEADRA